MKVPSGNIPEYGKVKYSGSFKDNVPHGSGEMNFYSRKMKFVGQFKNGRYMGKVFGDPKGITEGVWKNGLFQYKKKSSYSLNSFSKKSYQTKSINNLASEFKN